MGRSSQAWTEEKIQKRFAEVFRRAVGRDWKPWLTVGRLTPFVGTSNRIGGRTTGRVRHYLSDIEWNAFLIYDWAASVVDIREQVPLDRGETAAIAEAMGVRHLMDPRTTVPVVMTTDFLLDTVVDGRAMQVARGRRRHPQTPHHPQRHHQRRHAMARRLTADTVTQATARSFTAMRSLRCACGPSHPNRNMSWVKSATSSGPRRTALTRIELSPASISTFPPDWEMVRSSKP